MTTRTPDGTGDAREAPAATDRCPRCGHLPEPGEAAGPCPRCGADGPAPARRRVPGAIRGLAGVVTGFRFLLDHPRLWTWILVPLALNVAIFLSVYAVARPWMTDLVPQMVDPWPAWIDWLRIALAAIVPPLMGIVAVLAALIATLIVSGIVNAPFYDVLSEKTENERLGRPEVERPWSRFVGDQVRAVGAAVVLACLEIFWMSLLFLLSFTAVGAPVFVAAGFFFAGYALIDIPLARKRYSLAERLAWGRRHALQLIALGVPVSLLPPLQPLGVVGATLAYLDEPRKS